MTECFADTLLIETLLPTKKGYNHKSNCFEVEKAMKFGDLKDRFAVGIIDNDKKQIKYLEEFEKQDQVSNALFLWAHKTKKQFIIQISPALESLILHICNQGEIDLHELGITNDLEELKKYTKKSTSSENVELKSLFKKISKREDIEEVRKLKGWLKILLEKNYRVDINDLKNA